MRSKSSVTFLVGLAVVVSASGVWVAEAQQGSNFTGGSVVRVSDGPMAAIAHFRFPAGVRTKWHIHEGGQIVLCESGVVRVQEKGGPVIELHAGEIVYAKPGVAHWHGSSPDQEGVQFNVTRGAIQWLEEVTDEEFRAQPKRLMQ